MKVIDITFIIIGIMVLILNYVSAASSGPEHFTSQTSDSTLSTLINLDNEDMSDISDKCVMYFTIFDKDSYVPSANNKTWKSIKNPQNTVGNPLPTPTLTFENAPNATTFNQINGFDIMNVGLITGPQCQNLGINFNSPHTIMIVCKHLQLSNALSNASSTSTLPISILKLYASNNSASTTNGLHLYIEPDIQTNDNAQLCKLRVLYADEGNSTTSNGAASFTVKPRVCSTVEDKRDFISNNNTDERINLPPYVLTFYFISSSESTLEIITMSEVNSTQVKISSIPVNKTLSFNTTNLEINKNKNWGGQLYNFSIFNGLFSTENITNTYNHVMREYKKRNDPSYLSLMTDYNQNIRQKVEMTKCPFQSISQATCNACSDINGQWYNFNKIVQANSTCKSAINTFCSANPTIPWCSCWDNTKTTYDSESCQSFRSLFAGKSAIIDKLTQSDLSTIKNQYNLLTKDDCKSATDSAVQNVWKDTKKIVQPASTRISIPSDPEYNSSVVNYYTEGTDKNGGLTPQLLSSTPVTDRISTSFDPTDSQAYQEYLKMQKKNGATDKSEALQNESYFNKFLQVIMPT